MNIDIQLVHQLIASQFPKWADLFIKQIIPGGHDNRTFCLGDKMIVRLPSDAQYAMQVKKEQQWLPKIAPLLPLPIPAPIAMGTKDTCYPYEWSVYQWIEGEIVTYENITDLSKFALQLASFLNALQQINTINAPLPGAHNFFRGGDISIYDNETRNAITTLGNKIDSEHVIAVWDEAISTTWDQQPVWIHGDMVADNLLCKNGKLSAVIDFGCMGIGDPACDLAIAWTFLAEKSRRLFCESLSMDSATWARGKGWALWKALITLTENLNTNPIKAKKSQLVIDEILKS